MCLNSIGEPNVLNLSFTRKLIVKVTYLSHWSTSAIFEYTFPTICKMWPNKINTCQLKIPTKQLKANSTITSHTKQNVFYLIHVTKQLHISHTCNQAVTHLSQNVFYLIPVTK
jgi:hypothetical protein